MRGPLTQSAPPEPERAPVETAAAPSNARAFDAFLPPQGEDLPEVLVERSRLAGEFTVPTQRSSALRSFWRLIRPHQWIKNALVFVPPVLGGAAFDGATLVATGVAGVALCLVASGTYVFNDLADIAHDRRHWSKRERPLASGALGRQQGLLIAFALVTLGLLTGMAVSIAVAAGLSAYFAGSFLYTHWLKRIALLDVLSLAGLFTARLVIGGLASGVVLSSWLLTFSTLFFLSLSLAKRHTEIVRAHELKSGRPDGRGYVAADAPMVLALGIGALIGSIVVFVLYLTQEAFVAAHLAAPRLLWAVPVIIFLSSARLWLISGRSQLHDDPVAFAVRDPASVGLLLLGGAIFVGAWLGPPPY